LRSMRQGTCVDCGLTSSIKSFYSFNGKTYCEPCVWKAAKQARDRGEPAEYISLTDNSVCARCGIYSGETADHPLVGGLALCGGCSSTVTNWPYPAWLKASLAALLILLVIALVHGRKYFHAGRTMYVGERLVEQNKFEQAVPYLQETLKIAPGSDKAVLLLAKAALKTGNIQTAATALQGHNEGRFESGKDPAFLEVKALWDRALAAMQKAEKAAQLEQEDGHAAEAARLMHEAADSYPEAPRLAMAAEAFDAGVAFERKDYDSLLALARRFAQEHPGPEATAAVASALACKYAATGTVEYKTESEEMLRTAERQVQGDAEGMQYLREYAERIRHRLSSREIISKQEYDRRFRNREQPKN